MQSLINFFLWLGKGFMIIVAWVVVIVLLFCAMTGCAVQFTRDDADPRDWQECKYEGAKAAYDNPLIANDLAKQCMELRGYSVQ